MMHDSFTWLRWHMTHSYQSWLAHTCIIDDTMTHDSFTPVSSSFCLTPARSASYVTWHDSFTWLICNMTHAYVTWRIHMEHDAFICDVTHSRDSFICYMTHSMWDMTNLYVTWLIHMWHDSCICDVTHSYGTWRIYMWHDSFICDMTH